jgi:hypothetical protein
MKKKILQAISWYSLLVSGVVTLIDIISLFQLLSTRKIPEILLLSAFVLIEISIFVLLYYSIKGQIKHAIKILLIYWIAQIIFFGIVGYTYCFITGPNVAMGIKFIGHIEWRLLPRLWSQEFTININAASERIYFGINLVPLLISIALIYCRKGHNEFDGKN